LIDKYILLVIYLLRLQQAYALRRLNISGGGNEYAHHHCGSGSSSAKGKQRIVPRQYLLLEARRGAIKPYLQYIPLQELQNIEIVQDEGSHYGPLRNRSVKSEIVTAPEGVNLSLQGLFSRTVNNYTYKTEERARWGGEVRKPKYENLEMNARYLIALTRSGEWTRIEVHYRRESGYKGRGREEVVRVVVSFITAKEALAFPAIGFLELWSMMGKAVQKWVSERQQRLNDAQDVYNSFAADDHMLGAFIEGWS
jgi:hypothetical protein